MDRIANCKEMLACKAKKKSWLPTRAAANLQGVLQMLINLHNRSLVTTSITVIGSAENRHHISILAPVVSFHDQLVCSGYQCKTIVMIECFRDVLTEGVPGTSWTDTPSTSVVRITPEEITHRTLVGNFLDSVKRSDVVECVDAWRQPTVQAEDLVVDEGGKGEVVEEVGEVFPDIGVAVFSQAFVIKSIDLCDLTAFVVTTEDGDA